MNAPKVGLLPHYLKLYDDALPSMRPVVERFLDEISAVLRARGLEVVRVPICRLSVEFESAVSSIERSGADAIISLHLAYSPSLESIAALQATSLPLILLDSTPDEAFGPDTPADRILYNHGIHGVQDLACMLRRRGRQFEIAAGHAKTSDVLDRVAELARGASAGRRMRAMRVLRIGEPFKGMGDFAVDEAVLRRQFAMEVTSISPDQLAPAAAGILQPAIDEEIARDRASYHVLADPDVHHRSVLVGLAVRQCLQQGRFGAFSFNFSAFQSAEGLINTVPFLEAAKAMARGIGYAGEGDVLTAGLVGALLSAWPRTTFTEIFCPDWRGQSLFLSHMGEINPAVAAGRAEICNKDFPWTPALPPAAFACAPAPGAAVLVNLAPAEENKFRLLVTSVEVLGDAIDPVMRRGVRGWVRPQMPLRRFLETYSRWGGTHHSALVLGAHAEGILAMGRMLGLESIRLGDGQ